MADFQVTFLGTGTSQGVPMIACYCPVCSSPDPRDQRTRSSLYIETPECSFVVDTGPDFRAQCLRENVTRVDAVVFTHAHTDHIMGFDDLRRFCDLQPDNTMPIYASSETMDDLQRVFRFAFDGTAQVSGLHPPRAARRDGSFPNRRNAHHPAARAAWADHGQRLPFRARRPAAFRLPERLQARAAGRARANRRGSRRLPLTPCGTVPTLPT